MAYVPVDGGSSSHRRPISRQLTQVFPEIRRQIGHSGPRAQVSPATGWNVSARRSDATTARPHRPVAQPFPMDDKERDTRYGQNSGSGANEPERHERKEQPPESKPRQGGDETRGDEDRLEAPIAPEEREKLR